MSGRTGRDPDTDTDPATDSDSGSATVTATDSDTVTVPDQGPGLVVLELCRRPGGHGGADPR